MPDSLGTALTTGLGAQALLDKEGTYRDGTPIALRSALSTAQRGLQEAELGLAQAGKALGMAKVREMKAKVSHETIAGIVIADASAVFS